MFFVLSKILAPFLEPLTYIVLFALLALISFHKPHLSKIFLSLSLCCAFAFSTPFLPTALIRHLEQRYARPEPLLHVDAVIVLSGMVVLEISTPDKIEFGDNSERILEGIRLIKQGVADKLILSGGSGSLTDQTKSEARMLRQFAMDFGIPEEQILLEPDSRNTYENAVETAKLMRQHGISSVILITTASHLPRAMGCFRKVGVEPIPYGVDFHSDSNSHLALSDFIPEIGNLRGLTWILHEYFGLVMYKAAGYI
ncbi:hypothetical protein U14_04757 [Candidatus Moduliflexus flocculans]|uniref:DUF218 domain-containing protein n=1 Tax=Candidatus Moduliflexus flocculans TaxID=1499966 RepID=A0A0S6W4Y1_9BACT|nr:hypothetical protein U14_04757 [Candidatus Moduliflexus flocculans]